MAPALRPRACIVWLTLCAATAGCGYALAGRGSFLPDHIREVAVPPVENRTALGEFEQILTSQIRDEFIGRGRYAVVDDPAGADAVLRVALTNISRTPANLNAQQLASRYLYTVTMRVSFEDLQQATVIWRNDAMTFTGEYDFAAGALDGAVVDQQRGSFERLADDVARSVVTSILEAF